MMSSRRAVLYLVLVFLLGVAAGALGAVWAARSGWLRHTWWGRGFSSSQGAVEWLDRELKLTPEQRQQLEGILDETAAGYRAIRERTGPEYEAVRQAGREKIRAVLTPEQRARFEELVRAIDAERAKRRLEYERRGKDSREDKK